MKKRENHTTPAPGALGTPTEAPSARPGLDAMSEAYSLRARQARAAQGLEPRLTDRTALAKLARLMDDK